MAKTSTSGQGRPKGSVNKTTAALKEMLLGSLDAVGGQAYFEQQAKANPVAYMSMISKLIPNELKAEIDAKTDSTLTVITMKYGDYNPSE